MGYNKRNDEINAITKESIAFAYYELLQCKIDISVTEICEKAGVSRNAYYRNFNSMDDIIVYCLILKWSQYCEKKPVASDNGEEIKQRLMQFFYSEKTFIRAIKKHDKLYLLEKLFRRVIIPTEDIGIAKYVLHIVIPRAKPSVGKLKTCCKSSSFQFCASPKVLFFRLCMSQPI